MHLNGVFYTKYFCIFILFCIKYNSIVHQIQLYFLYFRPISNAIVVIVLYIKSSCIVLQVHYSFILYIVLQIQLYHVSKSAVLYIKYNCTVYQA